MYISNDIKIAKILDNAGVDRVFIDLEWLGKEERQKGMDTVKSKHCESDVSAVASILNRAELLVRVNPINTDSEREINSVIEKGADMVMLPMFKTKNEVERFLRIVNHRVKCILLLEHIEAVKNIDDILQLEGIDEIHIGLNDLHLSLGLKFMFEVFSNGLIDEITCKIKSKKIPYGIGGISRLHDGDIPAEIVIAEHYRLGSSAAILSRGFCDIIETDNYNEIEKKFIMQVNEIRAYEKEVESKEEDFFDMNRKLMYSLINKVVNNKIKP